MEKVEKNELVEEFVRRNGLKNIKSIRNIPLKVARDRKGEFDSD